MRVSNHAAMIITSGGRWAVTIKGAALLTAVAANLHTYTLTHTLSEILACSHTLINVYTISHAR